jgi:PPM family protein phosphatase
LSDGAGGHAAGERAARLVVERVLGGFRSRPPVDGRDLAELLLDAHDAVVAGQRQSAATTGASAILQWVLDTGLVDAARMDKARNRGVLLAALGSEEEVAPHVSGPLELQRADAFLLCSGWWGGLEPEVFSKSLAEAPMPEDWLPGCPLASAV